MLRINSASRRNTFWIALVCIYSYATNQNSVSGFSTKSQSGSIFQSVKIVTTLPLHSTSNKEIEPISTTVVPALWQIAIAGGIATLIGDSIVHPIDCVKTLQQSDSGMGLSFIQASKSLMSEHGMLGFYSGLGAYASSDAVGGCIKLSVYEAAKQWVEKRLAQPELALFPCAALAFLAASIVMVPGESLKQTLQVGNYDTLDAAVRGIMATEGISGFFRGYPLIALRDIPYTMLELGLYDNGKRIIKQMRPTNEELQPWETIVLAAVVGAICAVSVTPMDAVKTKIMVDGYTNCGECLSHMINEQGISAVFAGGWTRVLWITPFTAIYLPTYDFLKTQLITMQSGISLGRDKEPSTVIL